MIIDAQVHTWSGKDDPDYPWDPVYVPSGYIDTVMEPDRYPKVIADMDAAGVDAALLVAPSFYGSDNSYALTAAHAYPDRLGLVARVDARTPDVRGRIERLFEDPVVVALRCVGRALELWGPSGAHEPVLAAAEELDVPVCVSPGPPNLHVLGEVAERHPGLRLVIDHLGLEAPPHSVPEPGPEPFKLLPNLLALAEHPNIHVKLSATAALSNEPFPFRDIWGPVVEIVGAFGADRVMWGTDYNRTSPLHSYRDAVAYLAEIDGLDEETKRALYSRTVCAVFNWSPVGGLTVEEQT